MNERTFVIVKPDAVQRGLVGEILSRFERRGLKLVNLRMLQVAAELARRHYAVHADKPFFAGLIEFLCSAPVVILMLEAPNAIRMVRRMVGATNPVEAAAGSIRADLGTDIGRNLVHASDGPETAASEIALWFGDDALAWDQTVHEWIVEGPSTNPPGNGQERGDG